MLIILIPQQGTLNGQDYLERAKSQFSEASGWALGKAGSAHKQGALALGCSCARAPAGAVFRLRCLLVVGGRFGAAVCRRSA